MSCMPVWMHHYYSPSAEDGVIKKSTCGESVGPKDTIEFIRNDVIIRVSAYEIEDLVRVFLRLEVPQGRQMRLINPQVHIIHYTDEEMLEGAFEPIVYHGQKPWNINELLKGETTEFKSLFGTRTHGKFFAMQARISISETDTFKVRLPKLLIDEIESVLPEISFKKAKAVEFFMPINC